MELDLEIVDAHQPFEIDPKFAPAPGEQPIVVSYGAGQDSTAMLVGMAARGIRPHLIIFAHVGNEWPETYEHLPIMQRWLAEHGFPPITVVQYQPKRFKHGPYHDLYGNCIQNHTLPSISFGMKGCSLKWKASVLDALVKNTRQCAEWLAAGGRVQRLIGYDAGPKDKCRGAVQADEHLWEYRYPLREWGWDRERCGEEIAKAGLPYVHKSACYFCASTQKEEVRELARNHPDLLLKAIALEDNAVPYLEGNMTQEQLDERYEQAMAKYEAKRAAWEAKGRQGKEPKEPRKKIAGEQGLVKGLWRSGVRGIRNPASRRPGSWRQFCEEEGLLPDPQEDSRAWVQEKTPEENLPKTA